MLEMVIWDVQHGSAAYVKTPLGKHIVIDLGTGSYGDSDTTFSPLRHLRNTWGVGNLDCVVITHPHRDHLDDIFNLATLWPKTLLIPKHLTSDAIKAGNQSHEQEIIDKYLEFSNIFTNTVLASANPLLANNNGGVAFQAFTPNRSATSNLNNHSIVTVISYAGSKIIIPGDNEPPSWNELLEQADFVSAIQGTDILVAPHHGRESGFSSALFDHINPRLTIVSDGRFGDTSATSRYSAKSQGWEVQKRSGGSQVRKCVTTRSDGVILVRFGQNADGSRFIQVTID